VRVAREGETTRKWWPGTEKRAKPGAVRRFNKEDIPGPRSLSKKVDNREERKGGEGKVLGKETGGIKKTRGPRDSQQFISNACYG